MVKKTKIEVDWKKSERKMQKPIQFKIIKNEFEELTREIYNNQDHNDFKIIINLWLKNAKKFWMEVNTCKTTKSEAEKMYNKLIQKDVDALDREKIDAKWEEIESIRKYNILNILKNIGSIFTGSYLHYKNVPKETMFERNIA